MEHVEKAITPQFLSQKLSKPVEKVNISMGSNHGDNYMCVIYGIEAEFSSGEKRNLVLKACPTHQARQQMIQLTNIFAKEYFVYDYWFSEFAKLQEDAGKPNAFPLAVPRYIAGAAVDYSAPNGPETPKETDDPVLQNYLLMEDARKHGGFKMADRMKSLDAPHVGLVLKELAKFHALGWIYKQKAGIDDLTTKFKYMQESFMNDDLMETFKSSFDLMVDNTRGMMETAFGPGSEISQRFSKYFERDTNSVMKSYLTPTGIVIDEVQNYRKVKVEIPEDFSTEPWKTTCHGDCWVNNFLFRYSQDKDASGEGGSKVEQVLLLDFQLMRDACPTTDLAYFLYTSLDGKTRRANLEDFLKLYHDSFMDVCNTLGYKPLPGFSLETLKLRFRLTNPYGLMIAMPLLFAVLKNAALAQDLETVEANDMGEFFAKGMGLRDENVLLRERLAEIVEEMCEDGVL